MAGNAMSFNLWTMYDGCTAIIRCAMNVGSLFAISPFKISLGVLFA
jgi:hypothetical protein